MYTYLLSSSIFPYILYLDTVYEYIYICARVMLDLERSSREKRARAATRDPDRDARHQPRSKRAQTDTSIDAPDSSTYEWPLSHARVQSVTVRERVWTLGARCRSTERREPRAARAAARAARREARMRGCLFIIYGYAHMRMPDVTGPSLRPRVIKLRN